MPDYTTMSGRDLLAALGDDASKWAEAFCQIVKAGNITIDESFMFSWFANAIEHSTDIREKACAAERERAARANEALDSIIRWADAYPLSVFPEPDLKRAHEVLTAAGMTLDAISASAMRHVISEVAKIAREAIR